MRGRTPCLVFSLRLKRAFPATWSARYHLTEETSRFIVSTGAPSSTISWTEPEVARSKIATNGPAYDLRCALVTAARGNQRMSDTPQNDKSKQQIRHLRELIAALDKRVPRIERVGEASIARDAAALKKKALERLAELQADEE